TKSWSAYISLESISEWAKKSNNHYDAYVGLICQEAVAKRDAGVLEKSPVATAFWQAYRQFASEWLPNVDITRLGLQCGVTSPWPRFGAAVLPSDIWLEHKPQHGRVDLTFSRYTPDALKPRLPNLPLGVRLEIAGQSTALRIAVPLVDHLRPFSEQKD